MKTISGVLTAQYNEIKIKNITNKALAFFTLCPENNEA